MKTATVWCFHSIMLPHIKGLSSYRQRKFPIWSHFTQSKRFVIHDIRYVSRTFCKLWHGWIIDVSFPSSFPPRATLVTVETMSSAEWETTMLRIKKFLLSRVDLIESHRAHSWQQRSRRLNEKNLIWLKPQKLKSSCSALFNYAKTRCIVKILPMVVHNKRLLISHPSREAWKSFLHHRHNGSEMDHWCFSRAPSSSRAVGENFCFALPTQHHRGKLSTTSSQTLIVFKNSASCQQQKS